MEFVADFHIHSHYSVATSKDLNPEHLDYWARNKGINVVGTGDFTHPSWLKELKEKLKPAEQGLFRLKEGYKNEEKQVRFLLTAEISGIYKKYGKVRKVHNLIFAPDFETVEKIQQKLISIGANITSDGRPILGLDSRDLLEIALEASEKIFFVPAHIWTPWFSALGDKSGFDSIEQCYDDLAEHIYAIETGLSSDPPMNWMCSFLDKYAIISNSDAHSPEKLGREANLFDTELSYDTIIDAIKSGDSKKFLGTVEFFPQEGKYHFDGHRKCNINWNPSQTRENNGICPVCGKKVTVGVMNRVAQLSDRDDATQRKNRLPFYSLIPLKEILSEISGVNPNTKKVKQQYSSLIEHTGSEFDILLHLSIEQIKREAGEVLAEAIRRMRNSEVHIQEGYDGEYGRIKVFTESEQKQLGNQAFLFNDLFHSGSSSQIRKKQIDAVESEQHKIPASSLSNPEKESGTVSLKSSIDFLSELNPEQRKAAKHLKGPAMIIAGPGTGKTRVLTCRIVNLIQNENVAPENILAVTFTNKAADEIKQRLNMLLKNRNITSKPHVCTFHSLGYGILTEQSPKHENPFEKEVNISIINREDKEWILAKNIGCERKQVKNTSDAITAAKQNLQWPEEIKDEKFADIYQRYQIFLGDHNVFDIDDLIFRPVKLLTDHPQILAHYRKRYQWIMIDEYQDINFAQYKMVCTLMPAANANLCVIGDPNQAIYGFRGADVRFMNKFFNDYPDGKVYGLKTSYRCSNFILQASSQVVEYNESEPRSMLQGLHEGVRIRIVQHNTDKSEAEFVARSIEGMIGGLRFFSIDSDITNGEVADQIQSLSDFAVLCRTNNQIEVLEKAFCDHSIPYQTVGNIPFFKKEPINSIIDLLKLSINPKNSFLRNKLADGRLLNESWLEESNYIIKSPVSVQEKIKKIIEHCLCKEQLTDKSVFEKLLDISKGFGKDIKSFVKFIELGTAVDSYQPNLEKVTLMTLHAAKGLEFTCVFIVGCEAGLLPYSLFKTQQSDSEEERRLLYVGMTRAKKFLYLTHAKARFLHGKKYCLKRSPFLEAVEKELVESSKEQLKKREKKEDSQLSLF